MKKNIPIAVHELFEPYVQMTNKPFKVTKPEGYILKVEDLDANSDFFFYVEECQTKSDLELLIEYKPKNEYDITAYRTWITGSEFNVFFDKWLNILEKYEKTPSFYDDPIVKGHADNYYTEFSIVDKDAERNPLLHNQILLLDEQLEYIEKNIEKYNTDENKLEIQEIKKETIFLRKNLTNNSKAWVLRHLSKIWGQLTKQGTIFMKEFTNESKRQLIINAVKFVIGKAIGM